MHSLLLTNLVFSVAFNTYLFTILRKDKGACPSPLKTHIARMQTIYHHGNLKSIKRIDVYEI